MTLTSELTEVPGVGPALSKRFNQLGLKTVADLIDYYPRRYDDYSQLTPINLLQPGAVSIEVTIKQVTGRYVRRGMHITEAVASDPTGSLRLIWFNQPYRAGAIKTDQKYFVSGQYALRRQHFAIINPSLELASDFPLNTARIVPVYRETKGLTSAQIRHALSGVLSLIRALPETLPGWIINDYALDANAVALENIHFPVSVDSLNSARRRIAFEEVFRLMLASLLVKQANAMEKAPAVPFKVQVARSFIEKLPFDLTDDQRRAAWQIFQDLERGQPMNRLIEGDVGAGKTVVAALAAVMTITAGFQVALMAPTELLARQHAETLQCLLTPLWQQDKVSLLVGSMTVAQKTLARKNIADGQASFIIGTHALIQDAVDMHKLALVIIDEQHRFGVDQRKALQAKAGHMPHVLSLTATPIPRSLALTLYGELEVTLIKHKPIGRQPIITEIVSPNARQRLYKQLDEQLAAGRQIFVVCPSISESELSDLTAAEAVYKELAGGPFKHRRVGLLHGKLKSTDKNRVMQQFVNGQIDLLVATTVIEVGVDVPNASAMVIENAERFGLAQIHQLRGRVGRSEQQGYCYLLTTDSGPPNARLRAIASSNDGFRLAELDLKLRGAGAIYGTAQHGALDLRVAQLEDTELIMAARHAAEAFMSRQENLLHYKELAAAVKKLQTVTNLN